MQAPDWLAEYFGFEEYDTDLETEVLAGVTTFLTMSYIVVVNPAILVDNPQTEFQEGIAIQGIPAGELQSMVAVVTILAAATATLTMALYANRPFAQAPGLGLNAFFAITVVGVLGVPWQTALAAVVVEGVIFIVLTAIGAREYVIRLFPQPVKLAVGSGIGLFLTIIGLDAMRVVVDSPATLVTLGPIAADPVSILSLLGLFFTFALYARGMRGSIIVGIVATTLAGYGLTYAGLVPEAAGLTGDLGATATYDITPLAGAFIQGLQQVEALSFALVVFTFFFVDFFDTAGTLTGVSQMAGFLDEDGNLPDMDEPLMADAVGTTVGGMLGTSTVTTYIESATGVEEGGRTGMTALVVAVLFLLSLAIVPLASAIPLYASHIALVVIGVVMLRNVVEVAWDDLTDAIPAAMTVIVMPFTYSIATGIAAGIVSYPIVKAANGDYDEVHPGQWVLAGLFVVYFVVRTNAVA